MTKLTAIISAVVVLGFSACNQSASKEESKVGDSTTVASTESAMITDNETAQVYKHYLDLKNNLVSSDSLAARHTGKELASALSKIQGCENTSALATKIASTNDLKDQRFQFTALSSDIIALIKHTEISSGKLYVQHCPMANEGKGGYWISAEEEVRNPYYGDEMLECGAVKETIAAK
ncbi:MAG: DUF3347 domain-containing protein [Daejeonella sp.]